MQARAEDIETRALSEERRAQLEAILDLTRSMFDAAEAADWHALAEMEAQRRHKLTLFFAVPPGVEEAGAVTDLIRFVLELDKDILERSEQKKDRLRRAMKELASGRRASSAYEAHTRDALSDPSA